MNYGEKSCVNKTSESGRGCFIRSVALQKILVAFFQDNATTLVLVLQAVQCVPPIHNKNTNHH